MTEYGSEFGYFSKSDPHVITLNTDLFISESCDY